MKKALVILFIYLLSSRPAYPEKKAALHELTKPETLCMDDTQYYVTEGASVFIYSFKDHKLIGKFGKAGEGPKEFKPTLAGFALHVLPTSDHLLVNSVDKLSFFKKNGEFVKEIKAPATGVPGALPLVLFNQTGQTDIWSAAWPPPSCWSQSSFRFFTTS